MKPDIFTEVLLFLVGTLILMLLGSTAWLAIFQILKSGPLTIRKDAENAMGKGCEAGLSRRLHPTFIRDSGCVRSNPAILVYREMLLADYYDGDCVFLFALLRVFRMRFDSHINRCVTVELSRKSSPWVMHRHGGLDFVATIQCNICQSSNH